jgi:hypothetical protein
MFKAFKKCFFLLSKSLEALRRKCLLFFRVFAYLHCFSVSSILAVPKLVFLPRLKLSQSFPAIHHPHFGGIGLRGSEL